MHEQIFQFVKTCPECIRTKARHDSRQGLPLHVRATEPLSMLMIDVYGPIRRPGRNPSYILNLLDIASRYWQISIITQPFTSSLLWEALLQKWTPEELPRTWPFQLKLLVQQYNLTYHESLGFSPAALLFGKHPQQTGITVDLLKDNEQHVMETNEIRRLDDQRMKQLQSELDEKMAHINFNPVFRTKPCQRPARF
ncbi:hypothetical protein GNI_019190, partial [Gregarina niphandrodes]